MTLNGEKIEEESLVFTPFIYQAEFGFMLE